MKTEQTHTDCQTCDYTGVCFTLLKLSHMIFKNCKQGRKSAVRVKAKDQVTLDEVKTP